MKTARSLVPIGMATLLPDSAQRVRHLEGVLLACLAKWGYREIIPPTFEYLDVLSVGLPPAVLEKCFKFADWTTGRILVLRPDVTAQIARIVAMGMGGAELPLRLCYRTTVFRYEPEHAGRDREVFQVGVELVGMDDPASDAEMISLLAELLKTVGFSVFTISLGHVGFYKGLLTRSGLSEAGIKQAELAAAHKDIPKLERILRHENIANKEAHQILEAPGRYGKEEVLHWGSKVAGRDRQLAKPIDRLAQVYQLLEKAGVSKHLILDLGEFRGFDYYDGIVFDVFAPNLGCELGGGGRYNHLLGRFGRDLPSTGFALDVDRLFGALASIRTGVSVSSPAHPIFLFASASQYGQAFQIARALREAGFRIVQEILQGPSSQMKRRARARASELATSTIVVLGMPGLKTQEAMVLGPSPELKGGSEWKVHIHDLPTFLIKEFRCASI